jgi:hypothetical protein
MSRAWIHFAHDLDPNGPERESSLLGIMVPRIIFQMPSTFPSYCCVVPSWPAFSLAKRESLQILYGNTTVIRDDYRKEAMDWMGRDYNWLAVTGR